MLILRLCDGEFGVALNHPSGPTLPASVGLFVDRPVLRPLIFSAMFGQQIGCLGRRIILENEDLPEDHARSSRHIKK